MTGDLVRVPPERSGPGQAPLPPAAVSLLLSCVGEAVILFDVDGLVTEINPEGARLTGWTPEQAAGRPLAAVCRLVDQPTRKPLDDLPDRAAASGGRVGISGVTVVEGRDGSEHLVRGTLFVGGWGGGLVIQDITERWTVDAAARRSSRAEFYRTLSAGMAHGLEDLATTLLARLAGIELSIEEGHQASARRQVIEAEKLARRMSETGAALLEPPSRGESAEGIVLVERVLGKCLKTLCSVFGELHADLALPERTGYAAMAPDQLEQVLNAYLMNAAEAQEGRGRIGVSACLLHLEEEMRPLPPGDYVMVSVRDHGPGIPEAMMTRIFDPSFSTKGPGRGLGLPVVWSIVHSVGGFITADSEPGLGATFGLFVPAARGASVESATDRIPVVRLVGLDDAVSTELVRELAAIGCSVAGTGALPDGGDDPPADLFVLAEGVAPPPGAAAVLCVPPAGAGPAWSPPRGMHALRKPLVLGDVLSVVAPLFWKRDPIPLRGRGAGEEPPTEER